MKTVVSYTLYYSRKAGHPFIDKKTVIWKGLRIIHSHSATVLPELDFELKYMLKDFHNFHREESDTTEVSFSTLETCKTMTITKSWEG